MEFETDTSRLRDAFLSVLTKGKKNNTYKFALARFLLDYCHNTNAEPNIRYTRIAEGFFDYYWVQECKSKLRQGPANQTPHAIQIIRNNFKEDYYPQSLCKIKNTKPVQVHKCMSEIRKICFDDVVPRFEDDAEHYFGKKRTGKPHRRIFYDYLAMEYKDSSNNKKIDPGGGIRMNPHAIIFLYNNYELLFRAVILEWIKFLEKRNFGIPRLAEKISGNAFAQRDQYRFRKYLASFADKCFYCGTDLKPGRCTHVDHVLPYDYVGATDLWNLVLACQKCNCTKSGWLPPKHYIDSLKKRNKQHCTRYPKLADSLSTLGDQRDISWHYSTAQKHGYPTWGGP